MQTNFEDPGDYLGFIEMGLTRRETQVFQMLEGHFLAAHGPIDAPPQILVTELPGGDIELIAPEAMSDLERVGLLAMGLITEVLEQIDELEYPDET